MFDQPNVLSDSERSCLQQLLKERYDEYGFAFLIDDDRHLAFEAIHVLADGDPDRLFAILHPADTQNHHESANHGRTWLFLQRVASGEVRACASQLPNFQGQNSFHRFDQVV